MKEQKKFGYISALTMFGLIILIFYCISRKLDFIINRKDLGLGGVHKL